MATKYWQTQITYEYRYIQIEWSIKISKICLAAQLMKHLDID